MARIDPDEMRGREVRLLAVARKLRTAKKIEEILSTYGVDYCIELAEYTSITSVIFGSTRTGVFFYVLPETLDLSRELLKQNRMGSHISDEP